jgi:hypothetical protein
MAQGRAAIARCRAIPAFPHPPTTGRSDRECIICGEGVAIPIRVAFDGLKKAKRPASEDPLFCELWTEIGGEDQIIARTIKRWSTQGR